MVTYTSEEVRIKENELIAIFMAATIILVLLSCAITSVTSERNTKLESAEFWKKQAVMHHSGQWISDKDGTPEFKWNDELIKEKL